LEATIHQERDQWLQQRHQFEQYIHQVQYERDEAIRTKTLETAELRRMNNMLKDTVRDLERQHAARGFNISTTDNFANDLNNFRALDLEDTWEAEFSLINSEDFKMEESDSQRQATPRPPASTTAAPNDTNKDVDGKSEAGFSWNTFYMCLLSGAFLVSQAGSKTGNARILDTVGAPTLPNLSEDYSTEAGNVLHAVLATAPEVARDVMPTRPAPSAAGSFDMDLAGSEPSSSLEALHTDLTTPSRSQQAAAAFSMSAATYNHITNPGGILDEDDDVVEIKPTQLQQLFASMQAQRDNMDKLPGMSSQARGRSVLLDRVPEKVLRDFKDMIAQVE
jgi:hypothetical protein